MESSLRQISRTVQPIYVFFDLNDPLDKNVGPRDRERGGCSRRSGDSQFYNTINEYKPGSRLIVSQGGLKPGKYKVELLLNNTLDETLEFTVTE